MAQNPEPAPCSGCGRRVAYAKRWQRRGHGGGKARVPHKCPHGEPCIFGTKIGHFSHNWPTCPKCLEERKREYAERTA